jgi:phosphatidylserine decarboxylase
MIKITKYGLWQAVFYPLGILLIMAGAGVIFALIGASKAVWLPVEVILVTVLIWMLAFFRDPQRFIPAGQDIIVAPADGRITDIETANDPEIGENSIKIGIFLSIFNVHINRMPCNLKVEKTEYKKGKFRDARHPQASKVNESNSILGVQTEKPNDKILIRQISGAVARHIVCKACRGKVYSTGQQFGMIKFGSRTELVLPKRDNLKIMVNVGDKVKAGESVILRYE